jgi:potassium-dependent mechanosensitive channel
MRILAQFCFFFLSITTALANPLTDKAPCFDIKKANQQLDHIYLQLSVQNLNLASLKSATSTLIQLTTDAEQCIEEAQKRLDNIALLMQQDSSADKTTDDGKTAGADKVYLSSEQKKVSTEQAQCRLFSIRAKEAIDAYKATIAKLTQEATLTRGLPLWIIIEQLIQSPPQIILTTSLPPQQTPSLSATVLCIFSLIGFSTALLLLLQIRKSSFAHRYLRIRKLRISHIILLSACFISGATLIDLLIQQQASDGPNYLLDGYQLLFFYLLACVMVIFFFKIKRVRALFYWYSIDITYFRQVFLVFVSCYTLSLFSSHLIFLTKLDHPLIDLSHTIFLFTIVAIGIYFIIYFCRAHRHLKTIKNHPRLIKGLGLFLFLFCTILIVFGFYALSLRLILSSITTFAIIFLIIILSQDINKAYLALNHNPQLRSTIIRYFGYKKDQTFTEFLILKTTIQIIIAAIGLFLMLRNWGFATYYIDSIYNQFLYGIHLGNTTIYPIRMVAGILVYCLMYLLFRSISTAISRHQQFEDEEETQVAIASILIYVGFALALISALLVAGFDFTGLAIVAGALSVGIGLGLQSIVNNFVSGLILLIEKPIKAGDRINIDGIEGFVKKIRVRSTHIVTPACEDIIVPNSDLITRRVTNYVYSNKQFSITCEINVPFGSDTKKARDLLLSVANHHEEVIKIGRQKPYVLFRSFGEKALIFQLCCVIKDVNKKLLVQSDLNFEIDRLLREQLS